MKYAKLIVYLGLILVVAGGLYFFSNALENTYKINLRNMQESAVSSAISQLQSFDSRIYWIGDCPEQISAYVDEITLVDATNINSDTMPVAWSSVGYTTRDADGNIVASVEGRIYPKYMLIVVNNVTNLSDDSLEVIRNCAVDNNVPVLFVGAQTINAFRVYINRMPGEYAENDTMLYSTALGGEVNNPIDVTDITENPAGFAGDFLSFATDIYDQVDSGIGEYIEPTTSET